MSRRSLRELEAFLTAHGVELEDRAFELELNSYGWRVAQERNTREGVLLRIEPGGMCRGHPTLPQNRL
jgi:hypothetical protein